MDLHKINSMFVYCPDDGLIRYKVNTRYHNIGDVAGRVANAHGYIRISVSGKRSKAEYAHRMAWAMHYGTIPEHTIDHINGIRTDNRISNLREATCAQNLQNIRNKGRSVYPDLPMGVCFHKGTGKFKAQMKDRYKTIHLGYYANPEDAEAAYKKAKKERHPFWAG